MLPPRHLAGDGRPATCWVREWVPQEIAGSGKKCCFLKWVKEDTLQLLKDEFNAPEPDKPKVNPTVEILFLCCYKGCNKAFPNENAYKKHSYTHRERRYACSYPGCDKKFHDSSKLKRHQVVHTGERKFICHHEGCGKAFSLDFNLRSHISAVHSKDPYHVCPYADCGKRYTQECKLKCHLRACHEKSLIAERMKERPPAKKLRSTSVVPTRILAPSSDRPFVCPFEGCSKAYIHKYKLNLHLKSQHSGYDLEENGRYGLVSDNTINYAKNSERKHNLLHEMHPVELSRLKWSPSALLSRNTTVQQLPVTDYETSEETEDESEEIAEGRCRRYREVSSDDEETEDDE